MIVKKMVEILISEFFVSLIQISGIKKDAFSKDFTDLPTFYSMSVWISRQLKCTIEYESSVVNGK